MKYDLTYSFSRILGTIMLVKQCKQKIRIISYAINISNIIWSNYGDEFSLWLRTTNSPGPLVLTTFIRELIRPAPICASFQPTILLPVS